MKTLILIISLSLMAACGTPNMFKAGRAENCIEDTRSANEKAQAILKRRGYRLDKVSDTVIKTKWRYISFYPKSNSETWFAWQIEVKFFEKYAVAQVWCLQQKRRKLEKQLFWRKCTDPTIIDLVDGSATSLIGSL